MPVFLKNKVTPGFLYFKEKVRKEFDRLIIKRLTITIFQGFRYENQPYTSSN